MSKVMYKGKEVDGEDVSFTLVREDWNTYQLHDGTELRMRLLVADVVRIPGEFDREGNPVYQVKSKNILVVKSPDNLKKTSTSD